MKNFFFILLLSVLFLPNFVLADGMMMAPIGHYIYETDQKGVIFFEDGREKLILSTSFNGDAEDFAWVVPTPSKPEVQKASSEIFTSLRDLTETTEDRGAEDIGMGGVGYGLNDAKQSVHVIEEKTIEYYDIAVLSADDKNALADWLNKNGYRFPEQYSYVLDSYVQNKWFFTAVKITKDVKAKQLQTDMWNGSLMPLQFEFSTDKPVFPLKISSVIEEPNAKAGPDFSQEGADKAILLKSSEKISADLNDYHLQSGTIEMRVSNNFMPNQQYNATLATIKDQNGQMQLYFGVQGGYLQLHLYDSSFTQFNPRTWHSELNVSGPWHYLAVSWQAGETPKFYINGIEQTGETYPQNVVVPKIESKQNSKLYINGQFTPINIDEIKISSSPVSLEKITENYNQGSGKRMAYDFQTILISSFNDNLNYSDAGGRKKTFSYENSAPAPVNYHKPSQVGIELYVFTPDKEQTLPGFDTRYAAWTDKKTIEDLAMDDSGKPWISLKKDKYYLTKLYRNMNYSEMDSDLFFRDAVKNSDSGQNNEKSKTVFYVIIIIGSLLVAGISVFIAKQYHSES